jgi:hypothetical protein
MSGEELLRMVWEFDVNFNNMSVVFRWCVSLVEETRVLI